MFETPILLLIFNRPDTTQQVFEAIRKIQPQQLFIAADGPRKDKPGDAEKCRKAREIIQQVDWNCEVKTLFSEENLGCGKAVSSGITWFFAHAEEGIILEDDTVPNESFFYFCQVLLNHYRHEKEIMHIGGNNYFNKKEKYSYNFSRYVHPPHGWATWRRAWQHYDFEMKDLPDFIRSKY